MKREYASGNQDNVTYFVGYEVEKSIFHNLKTLFVAEPFPDSEYLKELCQKNNCAHVYLGANHIFFDLNSSNYKEMLVHNVGVASSLIENGQCVTMELEHKVVWDTPMIFSILEPIMTSEDFNLMISLKMPNAECIKNLSVKIDDSGFNETNSGVWVMNKSDTAFTSWSEYSKDKIIF